LQQFTKGDSLDGIYEEIKQQFQKSKDDLDRIVKNMIAEMREGLEPVSESSLKMIPTFVTKLPTGKEKGSAYAIDMGGSNLRIIKVKLDGNGKAEIISSVQAVIPAAIQQSSADILFDFIVDTITKLLKEEQVKMGFTFSFPVNQVTLNAGYLIKWTKGFVAKDVVDKDVVDLLNKAMIKKGIRANVNALLNDTVGTLISGSFQEVNADCCIGLILGTGSNACYYEKVENIKKIKPDATSPVKNMVINMEGGNFGSRRIGQDMPVTKWDHILNKQSNNPNHQILEKQISGMYLGEISRLILIDLIQQGKIFTSVKDKKLRLDEAYKFDTSMMSDIEVDKTPELANIKKILEEFGIDKSTKEERLFVQKIAHLVAERAAALSAAQLVSCIRQMGKEQKEVFVAVDGSVFEKYPNFKTMMDHYLKVQLGHSKVRLVLAKDGSGVGAAIASFIYN
jgi:hexokinase